MKFKIKANDAKFDLVNEVVEKVKELREEDPNYDLDECISDVLQDYFTDINTVVEMFKWIAAYEDDVYNNVFEVTYDYISGEVHEKFE